VVLPREVNEWSKIVATVKKMLAIEQILAIIEKNDYLQIDRLVECEITDFLARPYSEADLLDKIGQMSESLTHSGVNTLKEKLLLEFGLNEFIGKSQIFLGALEKIPPASQSHATVLIAGESGTGKESIARAIHYLGPRSSKRFVPVNCGGIPETLFENEFFGHAKGAYTDASHDQGGLIEEANGGTIFLDEINSLSFSAQSKLLRFLEDRKYKPLGSSKYVEADVRIICATNLNLHEEVNTHRFREDLYYRLNVLAIEVPPLRSRTGDAIILAQHYLKTFSDDYNRGMMCFDGAARNKIEKHNWPGNIRELRNIIERSVVLSALSIIRASDLAIDVVPEPELTLAGLQEAKELAISKFEKEYLLMSLERNDWNISKASNFAHKDRRAFHRLMKKHGIERVTFS
jgi:two-component system response regulator GlrR